MDIYEKSALEARHREMAGVGAAYAAPLRQCLRNIYFLLGPNRDIINCQRITLKITRCLAAGARSIVYEKTSFSHCSG